MKCEADNCPNLGEYREDHEAFLCNSHAELPTYGTMLQAKVWTPKTFWDRMTDGLFTVLAYALYVPLLVVAAWKSLDGPLATDKVNPPG